MKRFKYIRTVLCILLCFLMTCTGIGAADFSYTRTEVQTYMDTILLLTRHLSVTGKEREQIIYDALLNLAAEDEEMFHKVLAAIAGTVDENSTFIPKDEYHEMMNRLSGETGGIGIMATVKDGAVDVITVLEGSPAEQAGLVSGDKIVEIDGRDVTGANSLNAIDFLRGEVGTQVTITILSQNGVRRQVTLTRYTIPELSVNHTTVGDIGYIQITTFAENTPDQVEEALQEMKQQGIKKLILDLRDNGGGVLDSGVKIADFFLDKGKIIVTIQGKEESEKETYYATDKKYDFDLCVLVNEYTASASEIVTGAIKDNKAGHILGVTTYGKGTVQGVYPLAELGGALKLTVQTYRTPGGEFIHHKGITPDQTVEIDKETYTVEDLPEITFARVMRVGDTGEDVKSIKYLLDLLNFSVGEINEIYDEKTALAVEQFQAGAGLYPYGVCDITTQGYLRERVLNTTFWYDTQLPAAIEYLQGR